MWPGYFWVPPTLLRPPRKAKFRVLMKLDVAVTPKMASTDKPYPSAWEHVAHLRVFLAAAGEWDKVATWRADMVKRGWRLLRVSTEADEIVAVFGKTKMGSATTGPG